MKFLTTLILVLTFSIQSFGSTCFELSEDGITWEENPFVICVEKNLDDSSEFKITLSKNEKNVAIYYLNSLPAAADVMAFGVNPMSGSFIDGSMTISIGYGEVTIGSEIYFYK